MVEFSLLVVLVVLTTILWLDELSWKVTCSVATSGIPLSHTKVPGFASYFTVDWGSCSTAVPPSIIDAFTDEVRELCSLSAHDPVVQSARESCF
jgi:hypothetical protein